jgi:hypothetical protein
MGRQSRNKNRQNGSKSSFPEKNNLGGKEKKNKGVVKGKDQGEQSIYPKRQGRN